VQWLSGALRRCGTTLERLYIDVSPTVKTNNPVAAPHIQDSLSQSTSLKSVHFASSPLNSAIKLSHSVEELAFEAQEHRRNPPNVQLALVDREDVIHPFLITQTLPRLRKIILVVRTEQARTSLRTDIATRFPLTSGFCAEKGVQLVCQLQRNLNDYLCSLEPGF